MSFPTLYRPVERISIEISEAEISEISEEKCASQQRDNLEARSVLNSNNARSGLHAPSKASGARAPGRPAADGRPAAAQPS